MKGIATMMISVKKITGVELTTVEVYLGNILNMTVVTVKMKIFAPLMLHAVKTKVIVIHMICAKMVFCVD